MKRQLGLAVQISILLLMVGCAMPLVVTEETKGTATEIAAAAPTVAEADCATPAATDGARCRELEAVILASTVRLELTRLAVNGNGYYAPVKRGASHATVVAGRYLLTHDHFGLDPANLRAWRDLTMTVYRSDGQVVLQDVPYGAFAVIVVSPGVLLFDFRERGDAGLFEVLGLPSAPIDLQQTAEVQPGDIVAQVNWDGHSARVDWVRIKEIRDENGIPSLILDNFVEPGASGGGVFHDGYLLANNWFRRTERTLDGDLLQQYTAAALNVTSLSFPAEMAADGGTNASDASGAAPLSRTDSASTNLQAQ